MDRKRGARASAALLITALATPADRQGRKQTLWFNIDRVLGHES